ncbi:MAG: hypothetical protein HYZ68_01580, partial [Chloroflexi bacterium]|nr:hypothetical protein [Chloroflexota bacterium]
DPQAAELWRAIYADLSSPRPGLVGAILGRAEPQVMRLACLYAQTAEPEKAAQHLARAIELNREHLARAKQQPEFDPWREDARFPRGL